MSNLLYYPYINLPRTDWTLRTLLYYDNIGSIVPQEYFYDPERTYDKFMLELVRSGLVTPINPLEVFENPWQVTLPFLELVERNQEKLRTAQKRFRQGIRGNIHIDKFSKVNIHADKFDENIFYGLQEIGLAERTDGRWYSVEQRTANNLMSFLATLISAKTNRLPTTDYLRTIYNRQTFNQEKRKRETILKSLIPFPDEINLRKLLNFKERHSELLNTFRTRVELIVLDPNIIEGTPLFRLHLAELQQQKEELKIRNCCYWEIIRETTYIKKNSTKIIKIPRTQILNELILAELMEKVNRGSRL